MAAKTIEQHSEYMLWAILPMLSNVDRPLHGAVLADLERRIRLLAAELEQREQQT